MKASTKITFEAVKSAVQANGTITDRGDMCRKVAADLSTNYGNVYLKVVKAEKELGLAFTSRKGRRPGIKSTKIEAPALVNVIKAKTGEMVAEGVTQAEAETMIAKAKSGKKAALAIQA